MRCSASIRWVDGRRHRAITPDGVAVDAEFVQRLRGGTVVGALGAVPEMMHDGAVAVFEAVETLAAPMVRTGHRSFIAPSAD
jgi:hypothetical protein